MKYLGQISTHGGLKGVDIANITNVSSATVTRWKTGAHVPHPKTQLVLSDLNYIVGRLEEYYSAAEIRSWLYAFHPQLEGRRAIDLIIEGNSEAVIGVLDRLDADAYL